jgi:hypothetical protein
MKPRSKMLNLLTTVLFLAVLQAGIAFAQSGELKEAARETFQKGLAAAQGQQWPLAVEYFSEAFARESSSPQIWYNLGLASSRVPGRELRAMALFRAFLADQPRDPRRKQVEELIAQLGIRLEGFIVSLLDEARKHARSYRGWASVECSARVYAPRLIAIEEGRLGLMERSNRTWQATIPEESLCANNKDVSIAYVEKLVQALGEAGNIERSREHAAKFEAWAQQQPNPKNETIGGLEGETQFGLITGYVKHKETTQAATSLTKLASIASETGNDYFLRSGARIVACGQMAAGQQVAAMETLRRFAPGEKADGKERILHAWALYHAGDVEGSEKALAWVSNQEYRPQLMEVFKGTISSDPKKALVEWSGEQVKLEHRHTGCWGARAAKQRFMEIATSGVRVCEDYDPATVRSRWLTDLERNECVKVIARNSDASIMFLSMIRAAEILSKAVLEVR